MKIQYELQRSRRKTLSIFILPSAKVLVKAPMQTSIIAIEKFIVEKSDWILKKQAEALLKAVKLPKLEDGEVIRIAGQNYTIKLCNKSRVTCSNGVLNLPQNSPKQGLKLFIKRVFESYICIKTKMISMQAGFEYAMVKISNAGKRWGSCSYDNVIRYSLAVALLPERLCDYVVYHELCHTVQKNHGQGFYKLLQNNLPDYKLRERELKEYSSLCTFFKEEE